MHAESTTPIAARRTTTPASHDSVSIFGTRHSALGSSRAGQALVEMVVGLVAILAIVAGLLQIGLLAHAHTQTLMQARAEAGAFAMSPTFAQQAPAPQYLYDWSAGADGRTHSRDDKPLFALSDDVRDDVLAHAKPPALGNYVGDNPVNEAYESEALLDSFRIVHGREESEDIPLYPVVRTLLYDAESIRLEADVWLTWSRQIE